MPLDSPLVRAAAEFARRAHAGQVRKNVDHPPYFVHLESVATKVAAFGYAEDELLAAAYLHDVLEDQPARGTELHAVFPPGVIAIVQLLTERKLDASGCRRGKRERFAEYLDALRAADEPLARNAAIVSVADKLDNIESLIAAQRGGDNLLVRLNTRPGQHLPQLARLREIYATTVDPPMLAALDRAVAELAITITHWLPGRAIAIAAEAHLGQFDQAGVPYILHPLRVMFAARTEEERMVAVLHDVVEDTPWTLEALADEGFSPVVVAAIDCLTRRPDETYERFLERITTNPLATRVKRLELADNLGRIAELAEPHRSRLAEKYHAATAHLASLPGSGEAE
ncbi:MAG: HD domain-containing protein [Polyangiaceae bacterium]|nr:HD domain-containing protein [Polyangiaceae bacterium]